VDHLAAQTHHIDHVQHAMPPHEEERARAFYTRKDHWACLIEGLQARIEHCRRAGYGAVNDEPESYGGVDVYALFGNRLELC